MHKTLLIVAAVLLAIALGFAVTEDRFFSRTNWGVPNVIGAAGCAGFAFAGGLALLGAAIAYRTDRLP